jgi:hypothetical protein
MFTGILVSGAGIRRRASNRADDGENKRDHGDGDVAGQEGAG